MMVLPRKLTTILSTCLILTTSPVDAAPLLPACDDSAFPAYLQDEKQLVELGRDLFYDPILSGNRTVACATCHHPLLGTSDGVALSLGDGGIGLGPMRRVDPANVPEQRIPRNSQSLFNLGYDEFKVMFHDGRVEDLGNGQIRTPLGPVDLAGPLAVLTVQAAFPVISADEMAGHYNENPISKAVRRGVFDGPDGVYQQLAGRVSEIDAYKARFSSLADTDDTLAYGDIAEALAAFIAFEWRADDSPFDRHLCDGAPLPAPAVAGMNLFYGKAGCAECHSGRFQTDHGFHAIAMPQIGPGKAERFETHARDVGRMRVTGMAEDAYRFRTPSLRNVAKTAPYGHAGAYASLEAVIRHHISPSESLTGFEPASVTLPELADADDFRIAGSAEDVAAIATQNELDLPSLTDREIDQLVSFLETLTDDRSIDGRLGSPVTVPSGLPVPSR